MISVTANIAPKLSSQLQIFWINKDITKAMEVNIKLAKIHHSLFIESSPGPVKYAAELLNLCSSETRLPLSPIKETTKKLVKESIIEAGLL